MSSGKGRFLRVAVAAVLLGALVGTWSPFSSASPASAFEIEDSNIVDGPDPAPDWGSLFGRETPGGPVVTKGGSGFLATSFTEDPLSSDALPSPPCSSGTQGDLTVFTGGSDKNGDAIPTLTYQSGSVPNAKDDLANVYAVADRDASDTIFYFGLDRHNTNGTSHFDFEFLKAPMSLNPTGRDARGCPAGHFTGSRTLGDILLSFDFTNGGALGTPEVRLWNGTSYEQVSNLGTSVGLFTNDGSIDCGDWRCRGSDGAVVNQLPARAFIEGYINATALGVNGCFSTFNAKSRSSHSWESELKDFALGGFDTCEARITLTPNGVNEVGDSHQLTAHVDVRPGLDFSPAPEGTVVSFTKLHGPGSLSAPSCTTLGTTGSCTVTLDSDVSGTDVVAASTTVQVGPKLLTRSTNGNAGPGGSGNVTKEWVDAYIKVTPDDVNPVGQQHVFDVEFGVLAAGAGNVTDVGIDADVTPNPSSESSTCANPTAAGNNVFTCQITINSDATGVFTAHATGSATVSKAGVPGAVNLTRSTTGDAGPGGNDGAVKTYVDARITVGPDGLNEVNDPHTVTGKVETKDGNGPWTPAPQGTTVNFARSGAGGFVVGSNCATLGTTGSCAVSISSPDVGTTTVSATATVTVNGVTMTRSTDSQVAPNGPGGSGNLTKRWADASIRVVETAVNEVNDAHRFTVTATAHRPGDEGVEFVSITPSVTPAPGSQSSTCASPTLSDNGTVATCTFTINNPAPGVFDVDASVVVEFDDGANPVLSISRSTAGNAGPGGNAGAAKTFVDARVSVGPDGVNAVGDPHTVTGKAEYNDGSGWKAAEGETITFAITQDSAQSSFAGGISSCEAGDDGTCSVQIVSSAAGVTWVSASTSYGVLGVTLNRTTAVSGPTDADNLRKEWVDAFIEITPDGVNPVGQAHEFDVKVTATSSGAAISFDSITTSVSPAPGSRGDDCDDPEVDGGIATCTVTINNPGAGVFTATATAQVTIGGVVMTVNTDGSGSNSEAAVKTYVDARISVGPDGVNAVGDPHPVNAHLEVNDGSGWQDGPAGVTIALDKLSGPGQLSAGSCETDADGSCGVVLTSDDAGTTVVGASATVEVLGVSLHRSSNGNAGPGGSDNLVKEWVNALVTIAPDGVNEVGDSHVFTITATGVPSGAGAVSFDAISADVDPTPSSRGDTCAAPQVDGNTATCTLTISHDSEGTFVANATATMTIGGVTITRSTSAAAGPGGSGPATKEFVDAYIKVTPTEVNPVNQAHVFDVEFGVLSAGADLVSGVSLSAEVTPDPATETSTCAAPTPQGGNVWTCKVTINSAETGVFTAHATGSATVAKTGVTESVVLTRSTTGNAGPGGNAGAVKTYVDARITVGPDGLNEVNDPHQVTATVETKDGNGAWTPAPSGTTIALARTGAGGFVAGDTCATSGASGSCSVSIVSRDVGTTSVSATATVSVNGVSLTRSTDANIAPNGPGGSGSLTKRWADASVRIVESAVNEVNDAHEFLITATAHRPANETVTFASVSPSVQPEPGSKNDTCASPTVSPDGSVVTCTFTINSPVAGVFDAHATVVVKFNDGTNPELSITRSTNQAVAPAGPDGNSGATKRFVDARVSVGPDGVNAVGDPHTVTGKAEYNDGLGWSPAVGETITFAITQDSANSSFVGGQASCVVGVDGTCSVQIASAEPGVTWVAASTSYAVWGVNLSRTTAGTGATDPDNLRKEWVDAAIAISPSAVNPVGEAHAFEVRVTGTSSGAPITFGTIATAVTPAPESASDDCGTPAVDGGVATCTLTINSPVTGRFTATASATVNIGGVVLDVNTDGEGNNSGPAVKTYVDASIQLRSNGVNEVGDPHPVTGHVTVDDSSGSGDAPDGTEIGFAIESGPGSLSAPSCVTTGGTGACTVTLISGEPGVTVVSAASAVDVSGVVFELVTDGQGANSGNLIKRWVDALITIGPSATNPLDEPHVFTVTVTGIPSEAAPVSFDSVTTSVTPEPGSQQSTCDEPEVEGDVATCTLTINSSVPGVFTANATAEVTMGGTTVLRSTDSTVAPAGPGGGGPAVKTYEGPEVAGVQFVPVLPRTGGVFTYLGLAGLLLLAGIGIRDALRRRRLSTES